MTFDAADLALIEIAEDATGLEKALVAEIRRLQTDYRRDEESAVRALEDCQVEAVEALHQLDKLDFYLEDPEPEVSEAFESAICCLNRITWR